MADGGRFIKQPDGTTQRIEFTKPRAAVASPDTSLQTAKAGPSAAAKKKATDKVTQGES